MVHYYLLGCNLVGASFFLADSKGLEAPESKQDYETSWGHDLPAQQWPGTQQQLPDLRQ
jgi:hypothetical protein